MVRTNIGLALAAMIAATVLAAAVLAAEPRVQPQANDSNSAPDLSGEWRLDADKSEDRGEGGNRMGRGRFDGHGRGGGRRPSGIRGMRLPHVLHIEQTEAVVRLADSTDTALEEIQTGGASLEGPPAPLAQEGIERLPGRWRDDKLEVERMGPRGAMITRTFELEDDGETLVIRTEVKSPRRSMDFKRVYRKVSKS